MLLGLIVSGTTILPANKKGSTAPKKKPVSNIEITKTKNKKTEDLDKIFDDFQKKIKKDEEKKKIQEQKELQKKSEKEHKIRDIKKELFQKYLYLEEFSASRNEDVMQKNILKKYQTWLVTIKNLLIEQHAFMIECLEYSEMLKSEQLVTDNFFSAWGNYISIESLEYGIRNFSFSKNKFTTIEAQILFLRYMDLTKVVYGGIHETNFKLTEENIKFLKANADNDNEEVRILSSALLKTSDYYNYKKLKQAYTERYWTRRENLIEKINNYNLSKIFKNQWFTLTLNIKSHYQEITDKFMDISKTENPFYKKLYEYARETETETSKLLEKFDGLINDDNLKKVEQKKEVITESKQESDTNNGMHNTTNINKKIVYFRAKQIKQYPFNTEKTLDRVMNRYNNPKKSYEEHSIAYNKIESIQDYNLMIKYHAFSKIVDYFIDSLAIKCDWKAEGAREGDLSYNIPGQLIYSIKNDENKTEITTKTGVFSYGVGKDKTLFHRCFSERKYETIAKEIEERIDHSKHPANNFTITTSKKEIEKELKLKPIKIEEYNIKENSFYVEIYDKDNDMTIRLFKTINN